MTDSNSGKIFNNILANAELKKIPLWAHLDLTYKCNLNCVHCYCQNLSKDFSRSQREMETREIFSLIDQLAETGSLYLTLSGGELFTRPDFFEIAFYAKKRNFALNIFTNGTLINEETANRLAELQPLVIEMSIYGADAGVHDAITRVPGSFNKLLEAVKMLKKNNLKVGLKSTLMKPNFHSSEEISKFSLESGADDYHFNIEISPKNDGSRLPQEYQLDEKEMKYVLSQTNEFTAKKHEYWNEPLSKPLCGTGSIGCYISPYGDVYPCIQLLIPMGNIRQKSFREIWYSASVLRSRLNSLHTYADLPLCRSCEYVKSCKKCIGLSHLEKKDMEACYNTLKSISKIDYELSGGG
ncbi:MAG: radical SAM protein [bacterium]